MKERIKKFAEENATELILTTGVALTGMVALTALTAVQYSAGRKVVGANFVTTNDGESILLVNHKNGLKTALKQNP